MTNTLPNTTLINVIVPPQFQQAWTGPNGLGGTKLADGNIQLTYNSSTGQANFNVAAWQQTVNKSLGTNYDTAQAINYANQMHQSSPTYKQTVTPVYTTAYGTSVSYSTQVVSDTTTHKYVPLPYARSIPVVFQLKKMRPFSNFYAFLDNSNINANIYPCVRVVLSGVTGNFLGFGDTTPSQTNSYLRSLNLTDLQGSVQAQYPNGHYNHTSYIIDGETIRYYATPTSVYAAVVVTVENEIDPVSKTTVTALYVTLMREYTSASSNTDNWTGIVNTLAWSLFPVGATIKGDISGATATVSSISVPSTTHSNSNGSAYGFYLIPPGQVKTGTHNLTFTDSQTNGSDSTSVTNVTYTAYAEIDQATETIITQQVAHYHTYSYQVETGTVTNISYTDPLAQAFILPATKSNGCFVSSIDLYFAAMATGETQPVTVQIVEMLNGYPTPNIVFNAESTVYPASIIANSTGLTATNFKFPGLVYLNPNKEYAVKILSNSTHYLVWTAKMGASDITDPTRVIANNPNIGSFFKSQNNSTWTADQTSTLTFDLKIAQFDISQGGVYTTENPSSQWTSQALPSNPFTVLNGSTTVKVYSPDHGLFVNGLVYLSGSTETIIANGTYTVTAVIDSDHFLITAPSALTYSGPTGGNNVTTSKDYRYDMFVIGTGQNLVLPPNTEVYTTMYGSTSSAKATTSSLVPYNNINTLSNPQYIMSQYNENAILNASKSVTVNFNIASSTSDLSPLLPFRELSFKTIENKINSPSTNDNTVVDVSTIVNAGTGLTFTGTTNIIGVPTTYDINLFKIGSYITISGTTSNNISTKIINIDTTTSPYSVYVSSALTNETPANTTIVEHLGYIDGIAPLGDTSNAIYITTPMILTTVSTGLQINFSATIPLAADIKAYYRTSLSTDPVKLSKKIWLPITMNYKKSSTGGYVDQSYTINSIPNFQSVQIKLDLVSTNSAQIPQIKNFRAIALA